MLRDQANTLREAMKVLRQLEEDANGKGYENAGHELMSVQVQAVSQGRIAQTCDIARESIFNCLNYHSSYASDQEAAEAITLSYTD